MGIDDRLEAFVESSFRLVHRSPHIEALECRIAWSEMPLLIRRLMELEGRIDHDPDREADPAVGLAESILYTLFDDGEVRHHWDASAYLNHPNRLDDAIGYGMQTLDERPDPPEVPDPRNPLDPRKSRTPEVPEVPDPRMPRSPRNKDN
jgi:hypothetical protein